MTVMQPRKDLATSLAAISMENPAIRGFVNQDHHSTQKVSSVNVNQSSNLQTPIRSTLREVESSSKRIGLIPVTIRLNPELATALKFAALQRQMVGAKVNTQQRIVADAIEMWLAANRDPQTCDRD